MAKKISIQEVQIGDLIQLSDWNGKTPHKTYTYEVLKINKEMFGKVESYSFNVLIVKVDHNAGGDIKYLGSVCKGIKISPQGCFKVGKGEPRSNHPHTKVFLP